MLLAKVCSLRLSLDSFFLRLPDSLKTDSRSCSDAFEVSMSHIPGYSVSSFAPVTINLTLWSCLSAISDIVVVALPSIKLLHRILNLPRYKKIQTVLVCGVLCSFQRWNPNLSYFLSVTRGFLSRFGLITVFMMHEPSQRKKVSWIFPLN